MSNATLKPAKHLGGFALLPCAKGVCQECATDHAPQQPHNQQSIFYQYKFYGEHGRWPTWADALAHCLEQVKRDWTLALAERGMTV